MIHVHLHLADDQDWGDEEEWEWEEDEDAADDEAEDTTEEKKCNGLNHKAVDDDVDSDDNVPKDAKGVPDIKIQGNLLKIDRKNVDWSDDEYDESPDEAEDAKPTIPAPPPPPPPGTIPMPPPPPPGSTPAPIPKNKSEKIEALKKRPAKRPDWNDLMKEIGQFRYSHSLLKKTVCNDRSGPMISKIKMGQNVRDNSVIIVTLSALLRYLQYIYESEQNVPNKEILDSIKKGVRLKHVKPNERSDRSKPNLRGKKKCYFK